MYVMGMAYRGTANNGVIQRLLHFAVSDVSDDVRRGAVLNLGFLLLASPAQCPPIVALLSESYNPHVRYGEPAAPIMHALLLPGTVRPWFGHAPASKPPLPLCLG